MVQYFVELCYISECNSVTSNGWVTSMDDEMCNTIFLHVQSMLCLEQTCILFSMCLQCKLCMLLVWSSCIDLGVGICSHNIWVVSEFCVTHQLSTVVEAAALWNTSQHMQQIPESSFISLSMCATKQAAKSFTLWMSISMNLCWGCWIFNPKNLTDQCDSTCTTTTCLSISVRLTSNWPQRRRV